MISNSPVGVCIFCSSNNSRFLFKLHSSVHAAKPLKGFDMKKLFLSNNQFICKIYRFYLYYMHSYIMFVFYLFSFFLFPFIIFKLSYFLLFHKKKKKKIKKKWLYIILLHF